MLDKLIKKYLKRHPLSHDLEPETEQQFRNVVVIPALAESVYIRETLDSLAQNDPDQLAQTMVMLVVNNGPRNDVGEDKYQDNQLVLKWLRAGELNYKNLNLFWIDAATEGLEISKNPCVGHARKIGLDLALQYADVNSDPLLISLDGDSPVDPNYLTEVREFFKQNKNCGTGVVNFQHQTHDHSQLDEAIVDYELFLRQYELGMGYAGSPYDYHTIGSTIVCRVMTYIKSGGMKVKAAGEDFYFLQGLKKVADVGLIKNTTVYPSARASDRVPFGTGAKMNDVLDGETIHFYNPKIFEELKASLQIINEFDIDDLMKLSELKELPFSSIFNKFLNQYKFQRQWSKILKNTPQKLDYLTNAFHTWFDAFRTLKFAHFCENEYPDKFSRITWHDAFNFIPNATCAKSKRELLQIIRQEMIK